MAFPESFHEIARRVTNWGRWGSDDEFGTLNLVTDACVRRGVAAARRGRAFSLAIPLDGNGPQIGLIPGRINPLRTMLTIDAPIVDPEGFRTSDDVVVMGLQAGTHWDSLAHASFGGQIYNGHSAATITTTGAAKCGIGNVRTLLSRGVLLDVARARGVERLGEVNGPAAITADDLDAACEQARVRVEPGDVVLVRTGLMSHFHAGTREAYATAASGIGIDAVPWFRAHDVAAVATDTLAFEVVDFSDLSMVLPVHVLDLVFMGMTQGQNFDLEALASDCADDGVYEFLLSASPEPFTHGLGAPVNPVAIK